jgi:hypothetical protein
MNDRILMGSSYFFKDIPGFVSKDIDNLELVETPTLFKNVLQITGSGKCLFKWRKMSVNEFIDITLKRNFPMEIGKFLIPEFNNEIGFTIKHLPLLKPLVDNLDDKHKYEKIIYESYILNNSFTLTNEQLMEAYNEYKKYRDK